MSKEDSLKQVIESFLITRNQHITVSGELKDGFDSYKVERTLCGKSNVDYNVFKRALDLIDGGCSLEEFLAEDLSKYDLC